MVPVNLWSTVVDSGRQWVDRRMVDRGSTVVDSAVDRVDRVDRVDSQGSSPLEGKQVRRRHTLTETRSWCSWKMI